MATEETSLTPETPEPPCRPRVFTLTGSIFLAVVLYALSIAPVARCLGGPSGRVPKGFKTFYAPVTFLYHASPPVETFYDWYFKIWGLR